MAALRVGAELLYMCTEDARLFLQVLLLLAAHVQCEIHSLPLPLPLPRAQLRSSKVLLPLPLPRLLLVEFCSDCCCCGCCSDKRDELFAQLCCLVV